MYSKILLNLKFKFLRKCQNKSVCVRRFLKCVYIDIDKMLIALKAKNAGKVINIKLSYYIIKII